MRPRQHAYQLEHLEPRALLSLAYYDSVRIQDFTGFPGGEFGKLAGASDDGEYLWSAGAERGATDESPAFLVIDGVYRPMAEFPGLAGALVLDINSRGQVLGVDQADDRVFLLDLAGGGSRLYLEDLVTDAPAEFDLAAATAMELGDDGIVVLADNTEDRGVAGSVWGLIDGSVQELWQSEDFVRDVFVEPGNTVYGTRWLHVGQWGWDDEKDVVRWSPSAGLTAFDAGWLYGVNSLGDMLVSTSAGEGIINSDGDFELGYSCSLGLDDRRIMLGASDESSHNIIYIRAVVYDGVDLAYLEERGGGYGAPITITDSGLIVLESGISRRVPVEELVLAGSDEVSVVVDANGRTIVSFVNSRGGLGSLVAEKGEIDFGAMGGNAREILDYANITLVGPRDGRAYRYVVSPDGFAMLTVYNSLRDRFEEPRRFGSRLHGVASAAALQGPRETGVIATYHEDGHLWLTYEFLFTWWNGAQDWMWKSNDITQNHLDKRGLATPQFSGRLDAFTTTWGAMNIVGLDDAGQVHAVWWSPGLNSPLWTTTNLSALAGAPKLVGNLAASATPWGGMQIHGTDERGHLVSLWWSPATGEWRTTDLTAQLGGPALRTGSLDIAIGRFGSINVVGATEEGEVVTYWWSKYAGWEAKPVIETDNAPRVTGSLSYFVGRLGGQHIAGVNANGHVLDLYWTPDTHTWRWRDLTALAEL
jgi:hypothetical protein